MNNKGKSQIELLMVMILFLLFGMSIYTLIYSGTNTQKKLISEKDAIENVRIAMSYIDVRIRQSDEKGKILVAKNPLTGLDSILITGDGDARNYDTWIYWYKDPKWKTGKIFECTVKEKMSPSIDASFEIVDANSFVSNYDRNLGLITNTVTYANAESNNSKIKTLSSTLHLRAGGN